MVIHISSSSEEYKFCLWPCLEREHEDRCKVRNRWEGEILDAPQYSNPPISFIPDILIEHLQWAKK